MRKFKNLSNQEQVKLREQFIDLEKKLAQKDISEYTYLAISVFDHWLTREEFDSHLFNTSVEEQKLRNKALYSFSKNVVESTRVVNFKLCGLKSKQKPLFRSFTSEKAKLDYFLPVIGSSGKSFFLSVLPDLNVIFIESWDDTNIMYLKDKSVKPLIEKWAAESGVYCLDKWT